MEDAKPAAKKVAAKKAEESDSSDSDSDDEEEEAPKKVKAAAAAEEEESEDSDDEMEQAPTGKRAASEATTEEDEAPAPKRAKMNDGSAQESVERSKSVFIGNLPFSMTKEWLEQIFSWCGDIERVSIPTDWESGKIKGFAFLDFADEDSAEKAVGKNGEDCEGRDLRINYSFPKNDNAHGGKGKGGKGKGKGHHELGEKSSGDWQSPWFRLYRF
ncbi:Polyadenylate-binding protein, putative [Perkinsus marinus ATCC 50983]|uniref:Polyadenylate-binding protein, putative n=1 Tax=Perkinsus marinus (strain ATCC 50983 / TXsc) TaxID=423536 RepID=C5LLL3_PERM5|nr:Polyadenylate-binding protein, putative [Perkinsus marinus ATCC 50983]EER02380.1 Polyadenylate-binding protein, putative [Perkinsus marinus ATCC 50983]|eukprot:XP_002769662.1 Polyadenylate-binding protein, putative [Perkinsus marinus ATCC 50983]